MKKYKCVKCGEFDANYIGANGDGVYLAGLAFDCQSCGFQWEGEEFPQSTDETKHWTHNHIKRNGEQFTAFDEAGLAHGTYDTYDDARDALVVYSALYLSDAGRQIREEERKKGAADFKAELHNASTLPVRIHAEGVFQVWLRKQEVNTEQQMGTTDEP